MNEEDTSFIQPFSDSNLSIGNLAEEDRKHRTSGNLATALNITKLCLGITFLAVPKAID